MYCKKCGKEINDNAVVCVHCGCAVEKRANAIAAHHDDAPSKGFAILGFFIPLAGLILYLVNKNTAPLKAKSAGKGALIGFIVSIVLGVITGVISGQ